MNLAEANKLRDAIATLRHKVEVLETRVNDLELTPLSRPLPKDFPYAADNVPRLGKIHVEQSPPVVAKRPVGRPRKT